MSRYYSSNDLEAGVSQGTPLVGTGGDKYLQNASDSIRLGFVRKVYSILSIQLLTTCGISSFFILQKLSWILDHLWIPYFAGFVTIFMMIILAFAPEMARSYPGNYLFLSLFTLLESVLVGFISAMYKIESVLLVVGLTGSLFLLLSILALTTKIDLTRFLPYLLIISLGLLVFGVVTMFFPYSRNLQVIYGVIGAVLFSAYIALDTQMIVKGDKQLSFTVDDYAFAALAIYIDIVSLFLNLLSFLGERRSN